VPDQTNEGKHALNTATFLMHFAGQDANGVMWAKIHLLVQVFMRSKKPRNGKARGVYCNLMRMILVH